jgi:predicted nucleotidyltransferase
MELLDHPLALLYDSRRVRVLDVLLSTSEALTGREVARRANLSPTTAAAALNDLETAGLVSSRRDGRANRWLARDDSEFLRQLAQVARVQDRNAGEALVDALGTEPVSVTLFGSTARGRSGPDSDVDILLVAVDRAQGLQLRRRAYRAGASLQALLGRPVHIVVMDVEKVRREHQGAFVQNVLRDGRVLRGAGVEELVS